MKRLVVIFFFLISISGLSQEKITDKPKLVIGIVVDQMRYDYLTRFWDQFGEDGFKKLVNEGFVFKNNHYNYIPTYTGPGHASIFTGTTPASHGIIGNNWYNKFEEKEVYCVNDDSVNPVGTKDSAGKMSPARMKSTTFGDQNRLHNQMRSKTIGVALKDRGAILPAGHTANAAYWFHGDDEAKWISSSFYMDELPDWVEDFNRSGKAKSYLKNWNSLKEISSYSESGKDDNTFERGFIGKDQATFPYDLKKLADKNGDYDIIKSTAFGNDLTVDFAKAAIKGEDLGKDEYTDILTLSFSSTDYVGHNFGVNSKEVEDTYLRLDRNLAEFISFLDENIGKDEYTLFLTADHGGINVPAYLSSRKIPAGYFNVIKAEQHLNEFLKNEFNTDGLVENISNNQIFLDYELIAAKDLKFEEIQKAVASHMLNQKNVDRVFTRAQMENGSFSKGIAGLTQNGFNQKRSGDVIFLLDPAYIIYPRKGSTHGSGFSYDTHTPLLFYGKGIKAGSTSQRTVIPDIAPTISTLLGISFPNATSGEPLNMAFE
ncbi:alkaline phosphatase PafA [Gramella sp. KN1008]|uniref:alkaline phosphatase PafA n=1 Tax=Gramella sp. KN1008 TaxID=2529298 RepID=UPI00103CD153|nr:alkaline phosphatase PafA [Gramella sp. KN1008]TBW27094.1 alkaline phosphatase family protein [Gramella sp. KN1008]